MRLGKIKIYKKILLSFLAVLVVTLALIMALFTHTVGRDFTEAMASYTAAKTSVARDIVQHQLDNSAPADLGDSLKNLADRLAKNYRAKVWLESGQGETLAQSSRRDYERLIKKLTRKPAEIIDDIKVWCNFKKGWGSLTAASLKMPDGGAGSLRILFFHHGKGHPGPGFGLGLLGVGLLIALMVYPVSRLISRPINQLQNSALRIAGGDLDHRAPVGKRRDEIGQLSRAFNHMTDRLQQMIHSGRELTANVSHELRSPLARIRVAEELIRDGLEEGLDDKALQKLNRNLDRIRAEVGELDGLIGRILDLSKLDLGRAGLNPGPVDLDKMAQDLGERFRPLAQSRNLEIESSLEPGVMVLADEEALRSALGNLIDNAVKYTPQGGRISLVAARDTGDENRARLTITNTAQPLSPTDLEAIFEPFHTVPVSGPGKNGQGIGLGLAMVQRIILRLGGTIEAANTAEGLQMGLTLPLAGAKA